MALSDYLKHCWIIVEWALRTIFSEIWIKMENFTKKVILKCLLQNGKQPYCLGVNVFAVEVPCLPYILLQSGISRCVSGQAIKFGDPNILAGQGAIFPDCFILPQQISHQIIVIVGAKVRVTCQTDFRTQLSIQYALWRRGQHRCVIHGSTFWEKINNYLSYDVCQIQTDLGVKNFVRWAQARFLHNILANFLRQPFTCL